MDFKKIQEALTRYAFPQVPSAQPLQQGQRVANSPGYQQAQAQGGFQSPPPQVDTNALTQMLKGLLSKFGGESTHSFRKPGFEDMGMPQAQTDQPTATPTPSAMPNPQASPIGMDRERLAQNISNKWGADTPLLKDLELYMQAGNQLPGDMEKLLPIALALRETQGGKDLLDPAKMKDSESGLGDNNVFNIRNEQGKFQNYPDLKTAILGNLEQGGESGGAYGLLAGTKPKSKYIYEDFRKSNDYKDLFKKWSPPSDKNGDLDEQTKNLLYILEQLKK